MRAPVTARPPERPPDKSRSPGAPKMGIGGAAGAEQIVGLQDNPEDTAATPGIQDLAVRRLVQRYGWGRPLARLVAELAYGGAAR